MNHCEGPLQVTILTGSIVRVWGVLEQVLKRHEHSLNKADRSMRIIRVDMDSAGVLIGVRFKESLLPEVCRHQCSRSETAFLDKKH
jgi:hypothetical protein